MPTGPLDQLEGTIWFDGELVPWKDAKIHVLTHSLHYGSCVFEGERLYSGKVFKLTEHNERLHNSCELIRMQCNFSVEELDAATMQVVQANNLVDGYVRPLVWRGSEAIGISAKPTKSHVAIAAFPWPNYYGEELQKRGLRLKTSDWVRPAPNSAVTQSKVAGLYIICTMSRDMAENAGYDDALMLDYRGQIAEASAANIFLVIDNEVHTPTPDCFLNGITRQTVMDLALKRDLKVIERAIFPDEIKKASEIFVTGTAAEVTPVGQIDSHQLDVGPITRQLKEDYQALTGK